MRIIYIAHPISGNIEENLASIRDIVRSINLLYPDVIPFVPYYVDIVSLDDNNPDERARGIQNDNEFFHRKVMDEVWLCGNRISNGMKAEKELAEHFGIPVIDKTAQLTIFK